MPAPQYGAPASSATARPLIARTEAVRPVPGTVRKSRTCDGDRSGPEVAELARPAREGDHAGVRGEIEDDVAERCVVARPVDDEVAVQHAGSGIARSRGVDDPRAGLDRVEVRGRDRAELAGSAVIVLAVLRHMKVPSSRRGRGYRR